MKLSDNVAAALDMSDTKCLTFEMTPELKQRYCLLADKLLDWLKANTDTPIEAYIVMQFGISAFEAHGIRGSIIMERDDPKH